ncbi:MAG: tyrosine-type recombinase/integrase [Thermoanaerobaculia bacterium]
MSTVSTTPESSPLTDRSARALRPRASLYEVPDGTIAGLKLRVMPSGAKTWSYRYRVGRGERRVSLGPFPALGLRAARDLARDHLLAVRKGADPSAARRSGREDPTVRELFDDCLERHWKRRAATWRDIERLLAGNPNGPSRGAIPRHWWTRPARDITPRDVIRLLDDIVEAGHPATADKVHAFLGKMFRHGVPRGMVDSNPVRDVPKPHGLVVRDADPLAPRQIRKLWSVLTREHPVIAAFYRLRLLTLQRGRQVRMMRWEDIEHTEDGRVGSWWTAPGSSTKNQEPDRVFLNAPARREIERLRPLTGAGEYVLASPRLPGQPLSPLQGGSRRIRESAGLPHDWARDFRLTGTTWLAERGVSPHTCDRVLGHKVAGVIRHYDRYSYDGPKREAVTRWGDRVLEILLRRRAEPGKVVEIRGRA